MNGNPRRNNHWYFAGLPNLFGIIAAILSLNAAVPVVLAQSSVVGVLFVEVRESQVRAEPKQWARGLAKVAYGDKLEEISRGDSWVKVKTSDGNEGYIHLTAVTSRQVVIPGRTDAELVSSAGSEVVLAGKGFSSDVEDLMKNNGKDLNYEAVNQLPSFGVTPSELEQFLRVGRLSLEAAG